MQKLPIIADIKDLGKIVESFSDFYTNLKQLRANRAHLISPGDEAYVRLATKGKENIGKPYGTWTSAGFEYIKNELPILNLKSRLLNYELAKQAVGANRNNKYFNTNSTVEYEKSLKQAEKDNNKDLKDRNIIILPSRDQFTISDKQNWEVLETILKDQAKPYFEFNGPITVYPIDKNIVDKQNGTILTQLWFGDLDYGSGFDGVSRGLLNDGGARGVKKESGKATSRKILPYTQKELDKNLRIIEKIKEGKINLSNLKSEVEEVAKFLKSLKQ
jgi:hypothetical protein